jgi:transcriptional regulator with XRE-family HTH domain
MKEKKLRAILLGNALKKARLELQLTQTELQRRSDCHVSSIADWEEGRSFPSKKSLLKICKALKIDPVHALQCTANVVTGVHDSLISYLEGRASREPIFRNELFKVWERTGKSKKNTDQTTVDNDTTL